MSQQFPYVQIDPSIGAAGAMPYIPFRWSIKAILFPFTASWTAVPH